MWEKILSVVLVGFGVVMTMLLIVEWNTSPIFERQEETPMIRWPRIVTVTHVGYGDGSGFVVGPELVLTAAHAVDLLDPLLVGDRPATIVKVSSTLDVALLRVPGLTGPIARFVGARMGQEVWIVGDVPWKCGKERIVHRGYVADVNFGDRMLIGGTSLPGLSGCPVMNDRGEVIGMLIAVRKMWGHPSFGNILVVPTATLIAFIEEDVHAVQQPDSGTTGSTTRRPDRVGVEVARPGCAAIPAMAG